MASETRKSRKIKAGKFYTLLAFFAAAFGIANAQTSSAPVRTPGTPVPPVTMRTPPATPRPRETPRPVARIIRNLENTSGIPAEKSIAVDANADVQLCVNNGNLKVNGWDRNEVRAMIENGTYVSFKVFNKNSQNQPAVLKILGYDSVQNPRVAGIEPCLRGDNIEIDVPRGASVRVSGRQYDAEISSVAKAEVRNSGGNIVLNDVLKGVSAQTFEGDLRVENVGGEIMLNNTNGNIFAYNAKPVEFTNNFVARTNSGAIRLQAVDYPQLRANSTSGTINYSGNILSGGQYLFNTQNGAILLNIPRKSSFEIAATFSEGNFQTDLPISNVFKTSGQPQRLTGKSGTGEATLSLVTFLGTINIKADEP